MNPAIKLIAGVLFALTSLISLSSYAENDASISAVLARDAKLYDAPFGKELPIVLEKERKFVPPLPVLQAEDGFLKIEWEGKPVWVKMRAVESTRVIRLSEKCGAMPFDNLPKSAATRGVGEPCKK